MYISKGDLKELKEIRKIATMENSSFDMNWQTDEMIKEKTRLWRETYLISGLDKIINKLEKRSE